jgi:microcystin degradation protein MlrC
MRIFAASLGTETNTFSPIPTSYANFEASFAYGPGEHPDAPKHTTAPLYVARRRAGTDGFTLIEGSCFWAEPSGTCVQADYEMMRDRILGELKAALPVEGVLFGLHGAMVAHGYDDCEGDLIERARKLVGPKVVIGCEYDLHCHLTRKRVANADISILYKEYPHTDFLERAEELVSLVLRAIRGEIKPVSSLYDLRLISFYPTTVEPMRSFVDKMSGLEKSKPWVLSVSFGHGFQHADVQDLGSRMLVVTDDRKADGDKLAKALSDEVIAKLERLTPKLLAPEEALARALARNLGATVIADTSDNAGGGAASDNTDMIRMLIDRDVKDAAVGPLWDPVAVRFCFAVGQGARFKLRFGGKSGPESGTPIDAEVEVIGLCRDAMQSFGAAKTKLGDCAAIRIGGVDVVLNSHRNQALGRELFTNVGIDPAQKRIVVVKSANHFRDAFGPIAEEVLYADGNGNVPINCRSHPFTKVLRPLWPLDPRPEGAFVL